MNELAAYMADELAVYQAIREFRAQNWRILRIYGTGAVELPYAYLLLSMYENIPRMAACPGKWFFDAHSRIWERFIEEEPLLFTWQLRGNTIQWSDVGQVRIVRT